jgi:hypothetical protein
MRGLKEIIENLVECSRFYFGGSLQEYPKKMNIFSLRLFMRGLKEIIENLTECSRFYFGGSLQEYPKK